MRRVLITGAGGFCGTHLARRLRRDGAVRLVGVSRHEPRAEHASLWDAFLPVDIRDAAALRGVVGAEQPDAIFHLAGVGAGAVTEIRSTIVDGTAALLDAVRCFAPDARVLLAGSAAEYGPVGERDLPVVETQLCRPSSVYGTAKLDATLLGLEHHRRFGTKIVVARPFNIVGAGVPTTLVVGALIDRIRRLPAAGDGVLRVGRLDTARDFIAVEDLVDAYARMIIQDLWGEVINLCAGTPTTIGAVVDALVRAAGRPISVEVDPALVRASDVPVVYGSWDKAHRLFGFVPVTSLEQSLEAAWSAAQ